MSLPILINIKCGSLTYTKIDSRIGFRKPHTLVPARFDIFQLKASRSPSEESKSSGRKIFKVSKSFESAKNSLFSTLTKSPLLYSVCLPGFENPSTRLISIRTLLQMKSLVRKPWKNKNWRCTTSFVGTGEFHHMARAKIPQLKRMPNLFWRS